MYAIRSYYGGLRCIETLRISSTAQKNSHIVGNKLPVIDIITPISFFHAVEGGRDYEVPNERLGRVGRSGAGIV